VAAAKRFSERAIKKRTRPMMGFKSFGSAARSVADIETKHIV
jgi:transposase-like protein